MPRKPLSAAQKRQASATELKKLLPAKPGKSGETVVSDAAIKRAIKRLES